MYIVGCVSVFSIVVIGVVLCGFVSWMMLFGVIYWRGCLVICVEEVIEILMMFD